MTRYNSFKREENARQLAREIIRVEESIQQLIDTNGSAFDVYFDEDWRVQTSYCQLGGCVADSLSFDRKEEAERKAATLTFSGKIPSHTGMCHECEQEYYESII